MSHNLSASRKFWSLMRKITNSRKFKRQMKGEEIRIFDKEGHEYCPLTACHKLVKNEFAGMGDTRLVAQELGIDEDYEQESQCDVCGLTSINKNYPSMLRFDL